MTTLSPFSGSPASIKNEASGTSSPALPAIAVPAKAASKTKPRKRVNTAEKRHQHNAIERQRRETLNGKFLSLARLLPALASSRRPSKSAIVNGSISHLTYQRDQRLLAAKLLRRLASEHDQLLAEVNEWRKGSGYAPKDGLSTWTEEMEEVCSVEKEVFGNFTAFDGDDNDNDDEDTSNELLEQANLTAANFSTGLITPRSSTELDVLAHSQALFGAVPPVSATDKRTATVNGMSWSHDFAFGANSMTNSMSSSASSLPFGSFISDSLDMSSTSSPANSANGHVLTPPTTAEGLMYNHTPSPRSSHSTDDKVTPVAAQQAAGNNVWTEQQMHFLQQQVVQQQLQRQQHHAAVGVAHSQAAAASFLPSTTGMFSTMFPQPTRAHSILSNASVNAAAAAANANTDAFTQSLLASMFPQQGVSAEQVEQWRKLALAGMPQQPVNGLRNLERSSSGTINMDTLWEGRTLKGF